MKKILVTTDFSNASRNAAEYAIPFAKKLGVQVQLLHVYHEHIPAAIMPVETRVIEESEVDIANERLLAKEIEYLNGKFSIEVNGDLKTGARSDTIHTVAEEMNAGLIIMGMAAGDTSGIGSTILKTIRKTEIPVLIIPEYFSFTSIKNIVLAVDFNEMTTRQSFEPLLEIVNNFDASLRVLHVEKAGQEMKSSEVPEKLQLAESLASFTYIYDRVENDNADLAIENYVQNYSTDMLVLLAHHHNIFERLFGVVHTKKLSHEVRVPLLVLSEIENRES
jgi:nucleotide-binding universal stress UspA family protein